jgi:hypothetical protein
MLAIAAWPSLLFQKLAAAGLELIIVGLPSGLFGVAKYFATAVPNRRNGGNPGFLRFCCVEELVSIAKHWQISL